MTHDLSSLDSTVALLESDDEITEEHARIASEAMEALPFEAFAAGATRLSNASKYGTERAPRLDRLNALAVQQPAFMRATKAYAEWKAAQAKK